MEIVQCLRRSSSKMISQPEFIVKKMLETVGFEVDEAEDGVICLEIVKKNRYDVILLDIHMPRMDGEQVFTLV